MIQRTCNSPAVVNWLVSGLKKWAPSKFCRRQPLRTMISHGAARPPRAAAAHGRRRRPRARGIPVAFDNIVTALRVAAQVRVDPSRFTEAARSRSASCWHAVGGSPARRDAFEEVSGFFLGGLVMTKFE